MRRVGPRRMAGPALQGSPFPELERTVGEDHDLGLITGPRSTALAARDVARTFIRLRGASAFASPLWVKIRHAQVRVSSMGRGEPAMGS